MGADSNINYMKKHGVFMNQEFYEKAMKYHYDAVLLSMAESWAMASKQIRAQIEEEKIEKHKKKSFIRRLFHPFISNSNQ
jgi:hypothetical protein